jgi:tetratricopeptide (TPR) repeat protein
VKKSLVLIALLFTTALSYAQKPAGVSVYTWTREDIFAGLISSDFEQLNEGMKKLEDILKQNPNDPDAMAMKAAGLSALAIRDLDKGDTAAFSRQYDEAIRLLDAAYKLDAKNIGVNAVYGGVTLYHYGTLPEQRRAHALQMARRSYNFLYAAQEKALENLPLHLKGELLAGVAETELRSGNVSQAQVYLKRMIGTLPDTAYARRAQQWLDNPASVTAASRLICQSCHDAGRLKNVLASQR